jgi:site-specific DNA recombinase
MKANVIADLYIRYSDMRAEDLREDGSARNIVEAERVLRERVAQIGWTVGEVLVENDMRPDGTIKPASAYKRKTIRLKDGTKVRRVIRPAFRRMLHRLQTGTSRAVVALDLDRTVRDPRDLEDLIDVVEAAGANARSLSGSLSFTDGGTDAEITMARIMVAIANKSSRDTARRVSAARLRQAVNGEWAGGKRPFGFDKDGRTIRPAEAAVLFEAGERVLMGVPLKEQARDLKKRGVVTSAGVPFTARGIREALRRPRTAGLAVHQGEIIGLGSWGAIIPEAMWRAVVAVLDDPTRAPNRELGAPPKYLGSCLFHCWCGATVIPALERGGRAAGYACELHGTGRNLQGVGHIRRNMEGTDRVVRDHIIERLSRPDAAELIAQPGREIDVAALSLEKAALLRGKEELASVFTRADDRSSLIRAKLEVDTRLDAIDDLLRASSRLSPLTKMIQSGDPAAVWGKLSLGERRAIVREIAHVEIMPTKCRNRLAFDDAAIRVTFLNP